MRKITEEEDRALLMFGFDGGQSHIDFQEQMRSLSRRGHVLMWHFRGYVKFYMTPLGWRRCLRLTRSAQSQAYKIIKKLGEFDDQKFPRFDVGEIEFKGHRYGIINDDSPNNGVK